MTLAAEIETWQGRVYERDGTWWYDVEETFNEKVDIEKVEAVSKSAVESLGLTWERNERRIRIRKPCGSRDEAFDSMALELFSWTSVARATLQDLMLGMVLAPPERK